MCMLCKDELLKGLKRYEFYQAGKELITSAKTLAEIEHIEAKIEELENSLFKDNYDFDDEF